MEFRWDVYRAEVNRVTLPPSRDRNIAPQRVLSRSSHNKRKSVFNKDPSSPGPSSKACMGP